LSNHLVCCRPYLPVENKFPFNILLGIRSFDIFCTYRSHVILCAFTNLTVSYHFI
jgi:hypothetical protein